MASSRKYVGPGEYRSTDPVGYESSDSESPDSDESSDEETTVEFPHEWSEMGKRNLHIAQVKPETAEYSRVIHKFIKDIGKGDIVKLERIQNKMLYKQYVAKKERLDSVLPYTQEIERLLWHGTTDDAIENIMTGGFNRSYCGKNATLYGEGVYFAVNAKLAASDTYSKKDHKGRKKVFLCKVLTGEYTEGNSEMRVPPPKNPHTPHVQYESVVDDEQDPNMFVIFHDTQSYPCYLITFK